MEKLIQNMKINNLTAELVSNFVFSDNLKLNNEL